jgi:hypothetical protein
MVNQTERHRLEDTCCVHTFGDKVLLGSVTLFSLLDELSPPEALFRVVRTLFVLREIVRKRGLAVRDLDPTAGRVLVACSEISKQLKYIAYKKAIYRFCIIVLFTETRDIYIIRSIKI